MDKILEFLKILIENNLKILNNDIENDKFDTLKINWDPLYEFYSKNLKGSHFDLEIQFTQVKWSLSDRLNNIESEWNKKSLLDCLSGTKPKEIYEVICLAAGIGLDNAKKKSGQGLKQTFNHIFQNIIDTKLCELEKKELVESERT